ncbi:hypothetical protein NP493_664g02001 [Ridgeia piscesae]|uniref:Uncharacterized protein n=1 Tax=Ridgeia piscesae TaxID=27915 RepID=A0AAD9NPW4_RIDPI|nr:hypothetical protein NP493_664g02001 [Ridgeia piscesae]
MIRPAEMPVFNARRYGRSWGSATNNPKTLLAYAETADNSTTLHRKTFFNFGIPRVKLQIGRAEEEVAEPNYERLRHNDDRSDGEADRQCSSSSGQASSSDRSDSVSHSSGSRSLTSSCSSGHLPGRIRMT